MCGGWRGVGFGFYVSPKEHYVLMPLSLLLSLPRGLPGVNWLQGSGQALRCSTVAALGILCHGKQRHTVTGLGSAQATWETVTAQAAGNGQSSVRQQRLERCPLF